MHKMHCCYAPCGLQIALEANYLSVVTKDASSLPESTVMNLIRNYRNWRRYRSTVNELSRLSNRELNDLGIARGDIPFVARKAI